MTRTSRKPSAGSTNPARRRVSWLTSRNTSISKNHPNVAKEGWLRQKERVDEERNINSFKNLLRRFGCFFCTSIQPIRVSALQPQKNNVCFINILGLLWQIALQSALHLLLPIQIRKRPCRILHHRTQKSRFFRLIIHRISLHLPKQLV